MREGEGMVQTEEDKLNSIKEHMKSHIDNNDWGLVIEMAWVQLKREGCKCLHLK